MTDKFSNETIQSTVGNNPFAVVAGGIAIGAIVAALLPRTAREKSAVGGVGRVINSRAKDAVAAARGVGAEKAQELGLTGDSAKQQMKSLFGKAGQAAQAAMAEAGKAARGKSDAV